MNELKRRKDESLLQHAKRLVESKFIDRQDYDYVEIYSSIFGIEISSTEARKRLSGLRDLFEQLDNSEICGLSEDELLQKIEDKKNELQKERVKLRTEKIEKNRIDREEARRELYYENIGKTIERLKVPVLKPLFLEKNDKGYILDFSDVHYNATFKSITNSYSRKECENRFKLLLGETIKYVVDNKINTIYIVNGGDSLQGMLRISDIQLNDTSVVQSLIEFQNIMASFLNELSVFCNVKYYHVNSANHTELRLLNAKAGQMSVEDMEKIIVNYLHDILLDNERVFINREFLGDTTQFEMNGFNFISIHGHQLKDIKDGIKDLSDKWDKQFDYLILGHYHSGVEMVVGERNGYAKEVLVCPSFVGTCPYADKLMVGGKAMAKIHTFEKKKGRVNTFNIILN